MTLVKEKNRSNGLKTQVSKVKTQKGEWVKGPPFKLFDIPYKEEIQAIGDDYAPNLVFIWYMGALNDASVDFKLPFPSYREKHFLIQTIKQLSDIKIGNESIGLFDPPPKDFKKVCGKHIHPLLLRKFPLKYMGPVIYESMKTWYFGEILNQIPREYFTSLEKFIRYYKRNFLFEPQEIFLDFGQDLKEFNKGLELREKIRPRESWIHPKISKNNIKTSNMLTKSKKSTKMLEPASVKIPIEKKAINISIERIEQKNELEPTINEVPIKKILPPETKQLEIKPEKKPELKIKLPKINDIEILMIFEKISTRRHGILRSCLIKELRNVGRFFNQLERLSIPKEIEFHLNTLASFLKARFDKLLKAGTIKKCRPKYNRKSINSQYDLFYISWKGRMELYRFFEFKKYLVRSITE